MKNTKVRKSLPDLLILSKERFFLLFNEYNSNKNKWHTPLGMLFSFILCLIATKDFQPIFGIKKEIIESFVYSSMFVLFFWLIFEITQAITRNDEELEIALLDNIKNTPDFTVIYIVKLTTDEIPRLLVEKNQAWGCYFLPYVSTNTANNSINNNISDLQMTIASYFGISSNNINIHHLRDYALHSEKFSESDKILKQFNFDFFFFSVPKNYMIENYHTSPFKVGGREFYWMTLKELMNDEATMDKNGDVIQHLEKNYSSLVVKTGDSFV